MEPRSYGCSVAAALYCTDLVGGGSNPSALGLSHTVAQHTVRCFFLCFCAFLTHKSQRNKPNGQIETVCHQPNRPRHVPFGPITPKRHKDAATLHHGASKATPSSLKASVPSFGLSALRATGWSLYPSVSSLSPAKRITVPKRGPPFPLMPHVLWVRQGNLNEQRVSARPGEF